MRTDEMATANFWEVYGKGCPNLLRCDDQVIFQGCKAGITAGPELEQNGQAPKRIRPRTEAGGTNGKVWISADSQTAK